MPTNAPRFLPSSLRSVVHLTVACTLLACDVSATVDAPPPVAAADESPPLVAASDTDCPEPTEPSPERPSLCARPADDAVRDLFCKGPVPRIRSLRELEERLGLVAPGSGTDDVSLPGSASPTGAEAVYLGLSTALAGHLVSPINPRTILVGQETALAFQRGVQQVEIASFDRARYVPNFYLVRFSQACNARPEGCRPGDLFTLRVEQDWARVSLDDDEALKNSPEDCRQCHQRGRDEPMLLMRELKGPWTHFFAPDVPEGEEVETRGANGVDLVRDFLRAHGDEPYAGLPAAAARATAGLSLQNVVDRAQPLEFDSAAIEDERGSFDHGPKSVLPRSPTWDRGYAAFKRGEQLAMPHYDGRPTDAAKQAALTAAYQRYRAGTLAPEALPDLADIYPDDPTMRAEIGLQTEPGATPVDALIQACASCHNDVLDQTISRARFSVALARMSQSERELAAERIALAPTAPGAMPPPGTRQLTPDVRKKLIAYLRSGTRAPADDARLERAAVAGMAGGAIP